MKIRCAVPLALALFVTLPALAQRGDEHHDVHANQGHIPLAAPPHRDTWDPPERALRPSLYPPKYFLKIFQPGDPASLVESRWQGVPIYNSDLVLHKIERSYPRSVLTCV